MFSVLPTLLKTLVSNILGRKCDHRKLSSLCKISLTLFLKFNREIMWKKLVYLELKANDIDFRFNSTWNLAFLPMHSATSML